MTASVSPTYSGASSSKHTGMRIAVALIGAATFVLGIVLLFNPVTAAHTLAVLIGIGFILGGVLEMSVGWESPSRGSAVLLGAVLVVGGLLSMFWPGVTLWVLAVVTGISLILHGVGRVVFAFMERHEAEGWPWLVLAGAFGILFGVLALAWPAATLLVLSLILGAQITVLGAFLVAAAFLPFGSTSRIPAGT